MLTDVILVVDGKGVVAASHGLVIAEQITLRQWRAGVNSSGWRFKILVAILIFLCAEISASAQISFASAVDLALRTVRGAKWAGTMYTKPLQASRNRRQCSSQPIRQCKRWAVVWDNDQRANDIHAQRAIAGVQFLSQFDYIRAARAGLQAANATLLDIREEVEEDTAITYISLNWAQQRQTAMTDEYGYALRLVSICCAQLGSSKAGLSLCAMLKQVHQ